MSSDSDEHSSSSPVPGDPRKRETPRSRSRSKQKQRRRHSDQHGGQYQNRKFKITLPEFSDQLMHFRQFQKIQHQKIPHQSLTKAYQKYKKDWEEKHYETFLTEYRNDAWFRQKYDPQFLDAIENQRKQNVKRTFKQFVTNFQNGVYANINLTAAADTSYLGYVSTSQKLQQDQESFSSLINNQFIDIILKQSTQIMNEPYFGFDPDYNTLFIMKIPRTISRFDIYEIASKIDGFKNITVSEPVKKNALTRYCWIQFANEESCSKAAMTMGALIIKNEKIQVIKSNSKAKRVKVVKNYPITRMKDDLDTVVRLIKKLDSECQIQNNSLLNSQFKAEKQKFDTLLLYLRRVHGYDYFTSTSYENERALALKLGSATLRIDANYQQMQGVQTVFKKLQDMANKRIQRGIDIPDYLGILREQIQKFIRETEKGKEGKQIWKCFQCDKKFKTCQFLAKHMIIKHNEIKDKKIQVLMDQAYRQDPNKITGFTVREDRGGYQRGRRPPYNNNYQRRGRKQNYKDYDEPEGQKIVKVVSKPMVNFLDI